MANTEKLYSTLAGRLDEAGFEVATSALLFAQTYHTGLRKDGVTQEIEHQLIIAHFLWQIRSMLALPEATIAVGLLHDVVEDHEEDGADLPKVRRYFGDQIGDSVMLLSKIPTLGTSTYYRGMWHDPLASVVKAVDRIHNVDTMTGVFTARKQEEYISEVRDFVLPMLKQAKRAFPQQRDAYNLLKHILLLQTQPLEAVLRHVQFALPAR